MYTSGKGSGGEYRRWWVLCAITMLSRSVFARNLMMSVTLAMLLFPTWSQAEGIIPAAMDRPALMSAKASQSTLLAVSRAGARVVAAGERGIILLSDDHGASWQQARVPVSANLTALRFIDDKRGWAVGHMGVVLHTTDGGLSWSKQLDGIQAGKLALEAVKDSGNKRAIKLANYLVSDGADKPFFDVWMDANGHGFVIGAFNLMFRTVDGGAHWQYWSPQVDNRMGLHLYDMERVGDDFIIVGEQGLILRSQDGGEHFESLDSPYEGSWFGVIASKSGSLVAYGLRGNAYTSFDHGKSWQSCDIQMPVSFVAATQLADGRIVLANQAGFLFASSDQGQSFQPLPTQSGTPITSLVQTESSELVVGSLRGMSRIQAALAVNNQ